MANPANTTRWNPLANGDNGVANIAGTGKRSTVTHSPYRSPRSSAAMRGDNISGSSPSLNPQKNTTETTFMSGDFWKSSFSSLSALASAALGSDTTAMDKRSKNIARPIPTKGKHLRSSSRPRSTSRRNQPSEWGPKGFASDGSPALRLSSDNYKTPQERKREVLLAQSVSMNGDSILDSKGNFKRRGSDDFSGSTSPLDAMRSRQSSQMDLGSDALVYIHNVQPTDTLTGVSIRYGCDMAVLRRSNGLWPSDRIQMREVVLLPIDACTLKGTRVEQLGNEGELEDESPSNKARRENSNTGIQSVGMEPDMEINSQRGQSSEPTWKHEYYIKADGFKSPIEVGRVPRQSLGFFPRARRKAPSTRPSEDQARPVTTSHHKRYDTLDYAVEECSSPSRTSISSSSKTSPQESLGSENSFSNSLIRKGRHRRGSTLFLSGPGGVGTLESKGAAIPGPAEDQLNKFVKSHFPGLANPPDEDPTQAHPAPASQPGLALEDVGSKIESWVKKMATRAMSGIDEAQMSLRQASGSSGSSESYGTPRGRSGYRSPASLGLPRMFSSDRGVGAGAGGGDLIELDETIGTSHREQAQDRLSPHEEHSVARTSSGVRIPENESIAPRRRGPPRKGDIDD